MGAYEWAWLAWITVMGAWFFALEIPAAIDDQPGNTLSEETWKLQGLRKTRLPRWFTKWFRLGLTLGFAWLVEHMLTGGWI